MCRFGFDLYFTMVDLQATHLRQESNESNYSESWVQEEKNVVLHQKLLSPLDNYIDTRFNARDLDVVNGFFDVNIDNIGKGLFSGPAH